MDEKRHGIVGKKKAAMAIGRMGAVRRSGPSEKVPVTTAALSDTLPENAHKKVRAKEDQEDSQHTAKEAKEKARTASRVRAVEKEKKGRKEAVGRVEGRITPRIVKKAVEKGKAKANGEVRHIGVRNTGSQRSSKSNPCVVYEKFILARRHGRQMDEKRQVEKAWRNGRW